MACDQNIEPPLQVDSSTRTCCIQGTVGGGMRALSLFQLLQNRQHDVII